jgi:hypothetical protein
MGELGLVGPAATNAHAAAFTAGYRCSIRQRHRCMTAILPDHQSARGGSVFEAACQQGWFFIPGVEPIAENRPLGGHIRYPGSQTRTVGTGGGIAASHNGVPETCSSRPISVAKTNMRRDINNKIRNALKFVAAITFRIGNELRYTSAQKALVDKVFGSQFNTLED